MALILELAVKRRAVAASRIIPCLSWSNIISNTGCESNREIATVAGIKDKKETPSLVGVVKREFATNSHDIFNVVCCYSSLITCLTMLCWSNLLVFIVCLDFVWFSWVVVPDKHTPVVINKSIVCSIETNLITTIRQSLISLRKITSM